MTRRYDTPLLPIHVCRGCGREYQVAWVFLVPNDEVIIDLCVGCARRLRYFSGKHRRRTTDHLIAASRGGRRDA